MTVVSVLSKISTLMKDLRVALPNVNFHCVTNPASDTQFKQSEILIADVDSIAPYIYDLPNIKWLQVTWAGVEDLFPYLKADQPPNFIISRFSGKHFGTIMSEYVLANIINLERNLFEVKANQKQKLWQRSGKIDNYRIIPELNIGILGLGNIGNQIAKTLHYLGAQVLGYGRKPTLDLLKNNHITKYFTKSNLPEFLRNCDYLINILPSTTETTGLLNGNVLESCKERGTTFINIGRGTIISEDSLLTALKNQWISAAVIDVFENEPLPPTSPLWDMPNVFVTPHVAGMTRSRDLAEQFKENLELFEKNMHIPTTIDIIKGY